MGCLVNRRHFRCAIGLLWSVRLGSIEITVPAASSREHIRVPSIGYATSCPTCVQQKDASADDGGPDCSSFMRKPAAAVVAGIDSKEVFVPTIPKNDATLAMLENAVKGMSPRIWIVFVSTPPDSWRQSGAKYLSFQQKR